MGNEITATFVKDVSENFTGSAKLWKLSYPVNYGWGNDEEDGGKKTNYIVTSAAVVMFSGAETYIFPSDEIGNVIDWGEMNGSFRGSLDHEQAIENAGWVVA